MVGTVCIHNFSGKLVFLGPLPSATTLGYGSGIGYRHPSEVTADAVRKPKTTVSTPSSSYPLRRDEGHGRAESPQQRHIVGMKNY